MSRASTRVTLILALAASACSSEPGSDSGTQGASETTGDDASETETTDASEDTETDTGSDVPDCTPGAFGCVCGEADTCSPNLACVDDKCTFDDCSPGWDGCPCDAQGGCNDGLFCVDGTCGCEPGSLGCDCTDTVECEPNGLACLESECWLPSPYPGCGWVAGSNYYFCGPTIAHPDYPIDCPVPEVDLVVGMPCPDGLTFEGCCTATATWWCGNGVIATMACG